MDNVLFEQAQDTCDTQEMADFLTAHLSEICAEKGEAGGRLRSARDVLLLESARMLRAGDAGRADQYADAWLELAKAVDGTFWYEYYRCKAAAAALCGDMQAASSFYEKYCDANPMDADAQLACGNTLFRSGRVKEARPHYAAAVKTSLSPEVAARNLMLTLGDGVETDDAETDDALRKISWASCLQEASPHVLPEVKLSATFDFPVFINCRDRLQCLQRLVRWLLEAGYRNICLLDNASTYPPLLAYYERFADDSRVTVFRFRENLGYQALWISGLLRKLDVRVPYVYTDPDVLPVEECPHGVVARLYQVLRRYPFLHKVGLGIVTKDLPPSDVVKRQRSYEHVPLEENLYFAPCDTTFALYAPAWHYTLFPSACTHGRMMIRHLPWYLDPSNLPEDERYYIAHADGSSTFAEAVKKDVENA